MHLKDDCKEFASEHVLQGVVKKYRYVHSFHSLNHSLSFSLSDICIIYSTIVV